MAVTPSNVRRILPTVVSDAIQGNELIELLISEKSEDVKLRTGYDTQAQPIEEHPIPARKSLEGIVRDQVVTALLRRSNIANREAAESVDRWERAIETRLNQYDAATDAPEGAEGEGLFGAGSGGGSSEGGTPRWSNRLEVFDDAYDSDSSRLYGDW